MDEDNSIKKYFQEPVEDSTSVFDVIPEIAHNSCTSSNTYLVSETHLSPDFSEKSPASDDVCGLNDTSLMKKVAYSKELSNTSEEPVICRIFSSPENEPNKKQNDKSFLNSNFFDMLGSATIAQTLQNPFSSPDDKGLNLLISESYTPKLGKKLLFKLNIHLQMVLSFIIVFCF